MIIYVIN